MIRIGRLGADVGIKLWYVARRPEISVLRIQDDGRTTQHRIVAVAEKLCLAVRRLNPYAYECRFFRYDTLERLPLIVSKCRTSVNEQLLWGTAVLPVIGIENLLDEVLRGARL